MYWGVLGCAGNEQKVCLMVLMNAAAGEQRKLSGPDARLGKRTRMPPITDRNQFIALKPGFHRRILHWTSSVAFVSQSIKERSRLSFQACARAPPDGWRDANFRPERPRRLTGILFNEPSRRCRGTRPRRSTNKFARRVRARPRHDLSGRQLAWCAAQGSG